MKIRYGYILFLGLALGLLLITSRATAGTVTGDLEVTSDNEGVTTHRWLAGYKEDLFGWDLGVKHGRFTIDEPSDNVTFSDTRFTFVGPLYREIKIRGYIGSLYNSDWALLTAEATAQYRLDNKWSFEANVERNIIDSFQATNTRVAFTGTTLSADYKITPELVGVGIFSYASMTDDNSKRHFEGRLIYDINTFEGLSVQYHHRNVAYDFNPVEYFAPEAWTRNLFGVGYVKGFGLNQAWLFRGKALTGPQSINSDNGTFTEIKLNLSYSVFENTDIVVFHDRITSTGSGYQYKWEYTGARVNYRF